MLGPISNHRSKFKGVLPEPEDNQESPNKLNSIFRLPFHESDNL
jgi:hypothetical protein